MLSNILADASSIVFYLRLSESVRFIRFHSLWPRWIKYLRLSAMASGLQASRTHHPHLCAQTAELRKRVESAVWEIYFESRISVPDMKDFIDC
jgi:hypothetical protein